MITALGIGLVAAMVNIVMLHFRVQNLEKSVQLFGKGVEHLSEVSIKNTESLTAVVDVLKMVNTKLIGRN